MTAFKSKSLMVITSKETVVVDGHLTTSRGPSTALAFAYELVEQLGGDAESLRTGMLYRDVFGKEQ